MVVANITSRLWAQPYVGSTILTSHPSALHSPHFSVSLSYLRSKNSQRVLTKFCDYKTRRCTQIRLSLGIHSESTQGQGRYSVPVLKCTYSWRCSAFNMILMSTLTEKQRRIFDQVLTVPPEWNGPNSTLNIPIRNFNHVEHWGYYMSHQV